MLKTDENFIKITEKEYLEFLDVRQKISDLELEIEKLKKENEEKSVLIQFFQNKFFGTTSEKTSKIEDLKHLQLTLFESDNPEKITNAEIEQLLNQPLEKESSEPKQKKKPGRRRVNPELPILRTYLDIPDEEKFDENGEPLVKSGHELTIKLHYEAAKFFQELIYKPVYVHPDSREYVKVTPSRPSITDKGKYGDSFVHQMVYEKFVNSMPLYRQMKSYNLKGADACISTMSDSMLNWADLYEPLKQAIKKQIFSSIFVHADESPLKYGRGKGEKFKQGSVHVYRDADQVYFFYGGKTTKEIKKNLQIEHNSIVEIFMGYLMCDGYIAYVSAHAGKLMNCWTHARRGFFKISKSNANAFDMVKTINKLYKFEKKVNEQAQEQNWSQEILHQERYKIRNTESIKVLEEIKEKLGYLEKVTPPASSMGKAIDYVLKRWKELNYYLENGALPIDNNAAERSLRTMVMGRKNYLFAGSFRAGQAAATGYTIMESCRAQELDPIIYMKYVTPLLLENRENPDFDYSQLTPKNIKNEVELYKKELLEKQQAHLAKTANLI
jgi:transposase